MKKAIFFTLGIIILQSCSGLIGNGNAVEKTHTVNTAYRGIMVEKAIRVTISDQVSNIHVRADELFMPFLEIYVNDRDMLVIGYTKNLIGYSSVTTEVTVPYNPLLFTFIASGASRIDTDCPIALNAAVFEASGASHFDINGSAINCKVELSGASRFEGFDFTAITLDCDLSGASRMDITCQGIMKIKASGASTINYKGDCVINSIETSGGSAVVKK
ncbi:MAG TPA: DUF2807 domain-containing protein [Bacteroidales bacterium]|nr:DUF2807 domain-containing protein [Bacteroidales bacterium]